MSSLSIFAVTYEFADPDGSIRAAHRAAHRAFLDNELAIGRLLLAGPLGSDSPSDAMLLVTAASETDALRIAANDPYSGAGALAAVAATPLRITRVNPAALASAVAQSRNC